MSVTVYMVVMCTDTISLLCIAPILCFPPFIFRVGQNRIYTPYMTVYLVISLSKTLYTHCIYMVLANPTHLAVLDTAPRPASAAQGYRLNCESSYLLSGHNDCMPYICYTTLSASTELARNCIQHAHPRHTVFWFFFLR